jgi:glutathione synthase/RimK-type ligase-like ATP-grasp enzyme
VYHLKKRLDKLIQHSLFSNHPLPFTYIPETKKYSVKNLIELLNKYEFVYLKNNRGGQGKGIYKVTKTKDGLYRFNGYTLDGEKVMMDVVKIKDFEHVLQPMYKYGGYLVQEGINSTTLNGYPLSIRVHVQILKDKWLVGGMYGKIATDETTENGVINTNRGAELMMIETLLSDHLKMNKTEIDHMINYIKESSIKAAEISAVFFPDIEFGVDFGMKDYKELVFFEINSSPAVGNFSKLGNGEMRKRIKEIRRKHLNNQ